MSAQDLTLRIGGEAGYGVLSAGHIVSLSGLRGGHHVFTIMDNPSVIRGGHNMVQVRLSEDPVYSHSNKVHLLVALNEETVSKHLGDMVPGGGIIYDEQNKGIDPGQYGRSDVRFFPVPLLEITKKLKGKPVLRNTVALGASFGLLEYDLELVCKNIEETFAKAPDMQQINVQAAREGYAFARDNYAKDFSFKMEKLSGPRRMLLRGDQAVGLAALKAGCKFVAGYPMTPGTPVLEFMAKYQQKYKLVMVQTEDEIAAINMIVGASFAGARSMTSTSGGGFALMVEALGLAGMTETPVVIIDAGVVFHGNCTMNAVEEQTQKTIQLAEWQN